MNFISRLFKLNKKVKNDFDLDINSFKSVNEFWEFITKEYKWYLKYSPHNIKNIHNHVSELESLIIKTTNGLREKMDFTYDEYWRVIDWDNLLLRAGNDSNKFKQFCSNCKKKIGFFQRYPKSICWECHSEITDLNGRKVEFFNTEFSGFGYQGYYVDTEQKEKYYSDLCYINGRKYFVEEGRFGGIVIQLKE